MRRVVLSVIMVGMWVYMFGVIIGLRKVTDDMKTHKNPGRVRNRSSWLWYCKWFRLMLRVCAGDESYQKAAAFNIEILL